MTKKLLLIWRQQPLLSLIFMGFCCLTLAFAIWSWALTPQTASLDKPVERWMTPGLVVHSWRLPPEVLSQALGVDIGTVRGQTLDQIARAQSESVTTLIARIEAAAHAYHEHQAQGDHD